MTSTLLSECRLVVTMDDTGTEFAGASIVAEDGWITYVGSDPPMREYDQEIDCRGFVAIPGLVNTHHHLYQTLTRAFPESEGRKLFDWLTVLYPIWAGLDEEMIYASTLAGLAELALSGCTTCADHLYVFPAGSDRFIDAEIEAARSLGMRFHPTRGSMDLGESGGGLPPDQIVQPIDKILSDCERVVSRFHDPLPGSMIRVGIAPCSPFSVTPELMRESQQLARSLGVRLHTHIAETLDEDAYSRDRFNLSPIQLLDSLDWLGDDVWLAHCVHPTHDDVSLLSEGRSAIAHCPTSNMLMGSGLAPVRTLLDGGITVGLGVDGSASNDGNDLRNEMKQALLVARVKDGPTAMTARQALRLATRGGAACLGREEIGCLAEGKVADVTLFDSRSLPFAGGEEDLAAAVVLGSSRPHTVLVHGKVIVQAGRLRGHDGPMIADEQNKQSARLLRQFRGE